MNKWMIWGGKNHYFWFNTHPIESFLRVKKKTHTSKLKLFLDHWSHEEVTGFRYIGEGCFKLFNWTPMLNKMSPI